MSEMIKVGMADYKITKSPNKLTTLGLGSCVGVCIIDPNVKIIGMAHIMLPSSENMKTVTNPSKFADTCLELMLNDLIKQGATKRRLICKIAGGAQMFSFDSKNDMMKVGLRNAEAVKEIMKKHNIPIVADDTGGNFGRTIEFDDEGKLLIKTIGHGVKTI